jgi:hypothetical protein
MSLLSAAVYSATLKKEAFRAAIMNHARLKFEVETIMIIFNIIRLLFE